MISLGRCATSGAEGKTSTANTWNICGIFQIKQSNFSQRSNVGKKIPKNTLPETNIFAPENGWLEDNPFLFGPGIFSGAKRLLVSGRLNPLDLHSLMIRERHIHLCLRADWIWIRTLSGCPRSSRQTFVFEDKINDDYPPVN